MARIMECIVTEPPVSGGVRHRVETSRAENSTNPRRLIDVIVESTTEVPRQESIAVQFILRQSTYLDESTIYSGDVVDRINLAKSGTINITLDQDPTQPATATLVTD